MVEEQLLVQRALAGDEEAFAGLVRVYQTPVYNLAYRMLGTPAEAEEAAQETFVRIYRRLGTYDQQRKLSSWVLAIASHYCVDRLRRRRISTLPLDEARVPVQAEARCEAPEARLLAQEREREMQELLAQLPAGYRVVLVLRYWQDLSYQEMADLLNVSESAVKSRLHRAREMMAKHLAGCRARQTMGGLERRVAGDALSADA